MKKTMLTISSSLLLLSRSFVFAENPEVFPLSDITMNMTSKELLKKYPTEKMLFTKENGDKIIESGILIYEIQANRFWDTAFVLIEDSQVISVQYFYANDELLKRNPDAHDYDKIVKNIKPLFRKLREQLGSEFEKKVTHYRIGETKTRSAIYIWKREKNVIAFSHSPVAKYKKGDEFDCQIVIVPTIEALYKLHQTETDSDPEDAKLWADAMDE